MSNPRILYVMPCWPHAKPFGSQMRVLNIARALARLGELKLAIVNLVADEDEARRKTENEFDVECWGTASRRPEGSFAERLRRVLDPRCINPHGWMIEPHVRQHIRRAADQFDVIWFSYLRPATTLEFWSWPRSVMDIDDIPSTYERTLWQNGEGWGTRLRARWRMWQWQRRERVLPERFTVLCVSSEPDREYLADLGPLHLIPNCFERPVTLPQRHLNRPPRLGFIGKFDYAPNIDGMQWFLRECWPQIKREEPQTRLRLIGKGADAVLGAAGPDVDMLGWVPDAADEMATWWASIVPVRIGAGTRLKVLEAFSRKCPLVGTPIGVFGHKVSHEAELLLANSAKDFASACVKLLRDPAFGAEMAERAWQRFLQEWTWESIAPRVQGALEDCLRRSGRGSYQRTAPAMAGAVDNADGRRGLWATDTCRN